MPGEFHSPKMEVPQLPPKEKQPIREFEHLIKKQYLDEIMDPETARARVMEEMRSIVLREQGDIVLSDGKIYPIEIVEQILNQLKPGERFTGSIQKKKHQISADNKKRNALSQNIGDSSQYWLKFTIEFNGGVENGGYEVHTGKGVTAVT